MRFKTVLVGMGRMGKNHLRVLQENSAFELIAIVDPAGAPTWSNIKPGIKLLKSIQELKADEFDCAIIASPTETHFEVASHFISLRKPILVEKPLASTSEQSRKLIELAAKNGSQIFVGHVERFNSAVLKLKEVISSGLLGQPIHFSFTRVGGYPDNVQTGNNVLLDLAVHDLDVMSLLVGSMDVHSSICHSIWKKGILDTAEILLQHGSGVSASVHVNWITPTKIRTIRVTGTRGVCFVDYILQTCTLWGGDLLHHQPAAEFDFQLLVDAYRNSDKIEFGVKKEEPLKVQLEHLAKALRGEPSSICTGTMGADAVRLAERALRLAQRE